MSDGALATATMLIAPETKNRDLAAVSGQNPIPESNTASADGTVSPAAAPAPKVATR